jgi:hypothetical protein
MGILFASLLAACCSPLAVFAAFEDTGTGARAAAMGGAYVSAGNDVLSLFYNPAALAQQHDKELTSEYSRLFTGLSDSSNLNQFLLAYGQPIKYGGTLAAGWKQFGLDNVYSERTLSLGYGEWVTSRVAVGLAVKQLALSYEAPSVTVDNSGNITQGTPSLFALNGTSRKAYSADLGALVRWDERTILGVSVQDVNQPNMALSGSDQDMVPVTARFGVTHRTERDIDLSLALTSRESQPGQQDKTYSGAAEKWWLNREGNGLGLRGSYSNGSSEFQQVGFGASYRLDNFQIDYAFVFDITGITLGDTAGTHRFTLTYRFAPPKPKAAATAKKGQAPPSLTKMSPEELVREETVTQPPAVSTAPAAAAPLPAPVVSSAPVAVAPAEQPTANPIPSEGKAIQPLTRIQLLQKIDAMVKEYAYRTAIGESEESRLEAFGLLYPTLKAYVPVKNGELIEEMYRAEAVDQAAQRYESLKRSGASFDARLLYLGRSLEETLYPALRDRPWSTQDRRDLRYRSWMEQALAKGYNLSFEGVDPHTRMIYWGSVAHKALVFEAQPSEPIKAITVTPAVEEMTPNALKAKLAAQKAEKAIAKAPATPVLKAPRRLRTGEWIYRVKEGDTLINLAERFYDDYKKWRDIYDLNQDRLGRGGTLRTGQILIMPKR